MRQAPIAPEGTVYILAGILVTAGLFLLQPWLASAGFLATLFVIFFFRNPRRRGPDLPDALLSPADGRIMAVTALDQTDFFTGPAIRITIFLSLFNVHINRAPMTGEVCCRHYRPGRFLPAFKSHVSDINERNTIGIRQDDRVILVHQITGFIARRIVCDVKTGDRLTQRQRFGIIRFGSCTELVCPPDVQVTVRAGDRVKGGQTIMALFPSGREVNHVS